MVRIATLSVLALLLLMPFVAAHGADDEEEPSLVERLAANNTTPHPWIDDAESREAIVLAVGLLLAAGVAVTALLYRREDRGDG